MKLQMIFLLMSTVFVVILVLNFYYFLNISNAKESFETNESIKRPSSYNETGHAKEELAVKTDTTLAVEKRDSKIGSTLEFSYLNEGCEKLINNVNTERQPKEYSVKQPCPLPVIPISQNTDKLSNKSEVSDQEKLNEIKKEPEEVHPDLYDKYLEPKPEVDSPYGFVYFPNKYWKQWHEKAPVCVPTTKCEVQPSCTNGVPVDVLDYTQVGSIMPKFTYHEEYQ